MRRLIVTVTAVALLAGATTFARAQEPERVLVFTRTAGFRHASIPNAILAFQRLGQEHGFEVEATEDPAVFTDEDLARFDAVAFVLTTGDVVPPDGEAAFERYLRAGGGYIGVHSAADTEYDWEFYGRVLAGAYFKNHPIQQPGVLVREDAVHPSTAHLPERWQIPLEEFYSFQQNPRPDSHVLLTIDESSYDQDPNTSHIPRGPEFPEGETGTMGDHPMSWCHTIDEGRVWYTALGHEGYLYEVPDFRQHLLGGIETAMGRVEADCSVEAAGAEPAPADRGDEPRPAPADPPRRSLPATGGSAVDIAALAGLVALLTRVAARR